MRTFRDVSFWRFLSRHCCTTPPVIMSLHDGLPNPQRHPTSGGTRRRAQCTPEQVHSDVASCWRGGCGERWVICFGFDWGAPPWRAHYWVVGVASPSVPLTVGGAYIGLRSTVGDKREQLISLFMADEQGARFFASVSSLWGDNPSAGHLGTTIGPTLLELNGVLGPGEVEGCMLLGHSLQVRLGSSSSVQRTWRAGWSKPELLSWS
jgi:hypothetical protein